jgi:hypothetical protein
MAQNAFENNNKTVSPNHQTLGGKKPKINAEVKYADAPAVKPDDSKSLSDARDKFAPNADKPTSASADKGQTDLPQLMKKVDPQGKAQVLPQMYQQLMQMTNILGMGSGMMGGMGAGGSGQNTPQGILQNSDPIPAGITTVINDSFTGALALLSIKYGFERVISVFTTLLDRGGIDNIDDRFQDIVKNSIANLIKVALYYGPLNIPVSVYDETIYGDIVPEPLVLLSNVPDGYVKQYYEISDDPYPGYIEWLSPNKTEKVYTRRPAGSFVYTTPNEETYSVSELEIAADLTPYIQIQIPQPLLTTDILNEILAKQVVNVEENITNNNIGNNSSQNNNSSGGGNMGGQLQSLMQMFTSQQLSKSVLNQGDVQKTMNQYTKDMSFNNQLFELANQAMGGGMGGGLGSLGNMGGISNIMSGFDSGGGGISGVLGNLGGGNLLGSFGGFGGGSGGGGGGAGSGFPGASGGGFYAGGDVTDTGKKNIAQMLTLLGIS